MEKIIVKKNKNKNIEITNFVSAFNQAKEACSFIEEKEGIKYPVVLEEWKSLIIEFENLAKSDQVDLVAKHIIEDLKGAIAKKSKDRVFDIYDVARIVEWEKVNEELSKEYDSLVDKGNDLLFS